jgi:hypothetical protein
MNSNFIRFAQTAFFSICIATLYVGAASAIDFSVLVNGQSGTVNVAQGSTLQVEVFIDNPNNEQYQGVGFGVTYDGGILGFDSATPREQIDPGNGQLVTPILATSGPFGLSFIDNVVNPNEREPGVVQLVNALGLSPASGDGSLDVPGVFTEARPHAEIFLTADAEGTTTLQLALLAQSGDALLGPGGTIVNEQGNFGSITVTVPEPGAMALGLVALSSVIGVVQIRRRFDAA